MRKRCVLLALFLALCPLIACAEAQSEPPAQRSYLLMLDINAAYDADGRNDEVIAAAELLAALLIQLDGARVAVLPVDERLPASTDAGIGRLTFSKTGDSAIRKIRSNFQRKPMYASSLQTAKALAEKDAATALLISANRPNGFEQSRFFDTAIAEDEENLLDRTARQFAALCGFVAQKADRTEDEAARVVFAVEHPADQPELQVLCIPGADGGWYQGELEPHPFERAEDAFALLALEINPALPLSVEISKPKNSDYLGNLWTFRPDAFSYEVLLTQDKKKTNSVNKDDTVVVVVKTKRGQADMDDPDMDITVLSGGEPASEVSIGGRTAKGVGLAQFELRFPADLKGERDYEIFASGSGGKSEPQKLKVSNIPMRMDTDVLQEYRLGAELTIDKLFNRVNEASSVTFDLRGLFVDDDDEVRYHVEALTDGGATMCELSEDARTLTVRAQDIGSDVYQISARSDGGDEMTSPANLHVRVVAAEIMRLRYLAIAVGLLMLMHLCILLIRRNLRKRMIRAVARKNLSKDMDQGG